MAAHSTILAWRIPWTEEPGGLQSTGSQRVGHDWRNLPYTRTHTHTHVYSIVCSKPFIWLSLSSFHVGLLDQRLENFSYRQPDSEIFSAFHAKQSLSQVLNLDFIAWGRQMISESVLQYFLTLLIDLEIWYPFKIFFQFSRTLPFLQSSLNQWKPVRQLQRRPSQRPGKKCLSEQVSYCLLLQ